MDKASFTRYKIYLLYVFYSFYNDVVLIPMKDGKKLQIQREGINEKQYVLQLQNILFFLRCRFNMLILIGYFKLLF
ncbi:hypothetical protein JN11_00206 [Mucilaginibacter frigoritolerans]|uniref:Uncharacterized protein n=1 Tax=Mucilaginibacter frigoritolerans TaxID=652788 RepID=A0A562UGI7_9SPHI|nr:hypothetical protein JN11_00206 [Mucilaginibacter frigoritolerans]